MRPGFRLVMFFNENPRLKVVLVAEIEIFQPLQSRLFNLWVWSAKPGARFPASRPRPSGAQPQAPAGRPLSWAGRSAGPATPEGSKVPSMPTRRGIFPRPMGIWTSPKYPTSNKPGPPEPPRCGDIACLRLRFTLLAVGSQNQEASFSR